MTDADLPTLDPGYEVADDQVDRFWEEGFVVLRGVLTSEEVQAYRRVIVEQAQADFAAAGDGALTFGGAFFQTLNLRTRSEAVARFSLSPRIGRIAASLLRVPAVRIYHDQALFKPPGGIASYWHQDQYFWPLDTDRSLGLWMPLTDVSEDMGTMRYAAGSHRLGDLGQHTIDAASEAHFDQMIEAEGLPVRGTGAMRAGDCALHLGWTVHGALANRSDRLREAMVVTFYPDGTRVGDIVNDYRANDAREHLGGGRTGDLAAGPHNDRVWG